MQKNVFHQVEFVDKNNLGAQNPRRDTSIPSVSAGLNTAGNQGDKLGKLRRLRPPRGASRRNSACLVKSAT